MRTRISALALVVVLAACGGNGDDASTDTTADTEPPVTDAPADTEPPATDAPADTEPPVTDAPADTEPPVTDAPAELAPIESVGLGDSPVGVTTITVDADSERPLTVDVWFPLAPNAADGLPAHRYTLVEGTYYESPDAVTASAAELAPDGPFPLVVYSHGSGGIRYLASYYTEAIASHGYVVAAPDHTGNTALERILGGGDEFDVTALNRPNDVAAVIDALTDPADPAAGPFAAAVDAERVAVTGHSFGGFTSYAMASGYANPLGEFAADERVDAIVPLAPATGGDGRLLSDEDLAAITVPALVIGGTNDRTTPIDPNVTRVWELSNSSPHFRLDLVDAQHQSFTDICDYQEFLPTLDPPPLDVVVETIDEFALEGCTPSDMPIDRAKDLTNTFAITFLDSVFGDGEMFTPDTHEVPDDAVYFAEP